MTLPFPVDKLIAPIFLSQVLGICGSSNNSSDIKSIANFSAHSFNSAEREIGELYGAGLKQILIYLIPKERTKIENLEDIKNISGIEFLCDFLRKVKERFPDIFLITDLCLCHLQTTGECGSVINDIADNDLSVEILAKLAVKIASSNCDALLISSMMDYSVKSVRASLDACGFCNTVIMVQSAKFDSALYRSFREISSVKQHPSKKNSYQVSLANTRQSLREFQSDEIEGADILVLKPAIFSLDLITKIKQQCMLPVFAYVTGGEYNILSEQFAGSDKTGVERHLDYICNLFRAGVDTVISYSAVEVVRFLK